MTTAPAPAPAAAPAAEQDLFTEPGTSASPFAATAIPRGFRVASDPPKVGKRVLAILADGSPEFVRFERHPGTDPATLFAFGYTAGGKAVVVKCWRPIPSNWTA